MHELREVLHEPGRQGGQVTRRGGVTGFRQPLGVLVDRALHAQGLRLVVHELDEILDRAAHAFGQRVEPIVDVFLLSHFQYVAGLK